VVRFFLCVLIAIVPLSCSRTTSRPASQKSSTRKPLFSPAYVKALERVQDLEPADVEKLEAKLQAQPEDYDARLQLIAYHVRGDRLNRPDSREAHLRHVLWLIQNKPDSDILASPHAQLDEGQTKEAEIRWLQALRQYSHKPEVVWNAVCFYRNFDKDKYRTYLQRAVELAPDNDHYSHELGLVYAGEIIAGVPTGAKQQLDSTDNVAVLEAAIRLLHSPKFDYLAEQYFQHAQSLDPSLDRASLLPNALPVFDPAKLKTSNASKVVRLLPKDFPELPTAIRHYLEARGCTIPQPSSYGRALNVIRGAFFSAGQKNWAVLCSTSVESTILAFRSATDKHPDEIARAQDASSREIQPVDAKFIMSHYRAYGGPEPPPIDHVGIDSSFLEKASITYYFYRGNWLQLQGAD
jgi:tetratricopeptide (TPR) repeat protein